MQKPKLPHLAKILAINFCVFVFALGLVESGLLLLAKYPRFIPPGKPMYVMRDLYYNTRNWIQFDPNFSRYDAALGYTLAPGKFEFSNSEFRTEYLVNSRGFRDDEASLNSPEIIVLGDSHAMGWGVAQNETFAQLLENKLGMKVLNAGISSYGTARELSSLKNISLDSLKFLIIQYCSNDVTENAAYFAGGNKLKVMSRDVYQNLVTINSDLSAYFFGKYTMVVFREGILEPLLRKFGYQMDEATEGLNFEFPYPEGQTEVELFLDVLENGGINLEAIETLVFELNAHCYNDTLFIANLKKKIEREETSSHRLNLHPIDLSPLLNDDHYFRLDDHMNPAGHRVVEQSLLEAIFNLSLQPENTVAVLEKYR